MTSSMRAGESGERNAAPGTTASTSGATRHTQSDRQWQPIATAPKTKRRVIDVWCVTDDHESAQFYFGATMSGLKNDRPMWHGRVSEVYWHEGAWRPVGGLMRHGLTVTPTHWMPLPTPPEGTP